MKRDQGKVYLVGAGPGDPELLTLKAVRLLKTCDAVLYDSLVPMEALTLAPQAEKIHVGKWRSRNGRSSIPAQQRRIETLMTELAGAGKTVVRLKGGDPVLFGRVGEEAEHLVRHGIAFEIVPGVTSALAVPAYAGIPVTDRRYSSQLTVVTGHERASGEASPDEEESQVDWEAISPKGTLVFLMCVGRLEKIKGKLLERGWPPEMSACIIERGTTPFQKTIVGTLYDIDARARRGRIRSPALLVVGKVVGLRKKLRWFAEIPTQAPMPEEEFNPCLGKSILSEPVPEIRS